MMIRSAIADILVLTALAASVPGHYAWTSTPTTTSAASATTSTQSSSSSSSSEMIPIHELLSTCVHACLHGCEEIRAVQKQRHISPLSVEFKNEADPKSAPTQADGAAQEAIVSALRHEWGTGLVIVGEEDDGNENDDAGSTSIETSSLLMPDDREGSIGRLRRDLCVDLQTNDGKNGAAGVPISDISIFVDPLDGTREFVEERLSNCQTLVGIAVNGKALAGAIGIPFPGGDIGKNVQVVYGQVGAGHGAVVQSSATDSTTTTTSFPVQSLAPSNRYTKVPRPFLATGDAPTLVMKAARQVIRDSFGGSPVLFGGAGNKILSTALGHVDCTVQHAYGGPWDTCAAEAVLRSMGGEITDLWGNEIVVHRKDAPSNANKLGFVATGKNSAVNHEDLMAALRRSKVVQSYIEEQNKLLE